MRPLAKILTYLLVVVLLAAVLSPPVYWLVQWLGAHGILSSLAEFPFRRFFSRTTQVSAIVLLVPLLWWLRIRSVKEFGIERNSHGVRDAITGLLLALIPVLLLGGGYLAFGIYAWKKELNFAPCADFGLLRAAHRAALQIGVPVHVGGIYSSDTFYDERQDLSDQLQRHGTLCVEMEAAELYTLAARYQRRALAVLTISDHILTHEALPADQRERSFGSMVEVALQSAFLES